MSKTLTRWILVNAALTLLIATFAIRLHAAGLVEENRRLLSDVVRRMERDCAAGIAPACDVALEARNSAGEFLDLSERCEFGQRAACQMVAQHRHELLSVLEISRASASRRNVEQRRSSQGRKDEGLAYGQRRGEAPAARSRGSDRDDFTYGLQRQGGRSEPATPAFVMTMVVHSQE